MSAYGFGALALSGAYLHGSGVISGEARLNGVAAALCIVALHRDTRRVAARTSSDNGGAFELQWLATAEGGQPVAYTVIAVDNSGNTNAAVQDWVRVAGESPASGVPAGDALVLNVSDAAGASTVTHGYVS